MLNWRTIIGFALLLFGIKQLYTISSNIAVLDPGVNPIYAKLGCGIWMAVGIYFIIKGMKKPDKLV